MGRALPSRPSGRAPSIVLILGCLSAAALFGVSLVDFGDPRIEARASAATSATALASELRLAWAERRRLEEPLPGSERSWFAADDFTLEPPERAAPRGSQDAVFSVLLDAGLASLRRGKSEEALEQLQDALSLPGVQDVARRSEALLGVIRAASAAGTADGAAIVRERRAELLKRPIDTFIAGTSAQLLATLAEPLDVAAAEELLRVPLAHLPLPRDLAHATDGTLSVRLDPWWRAVERRLTAAGAGQQPGEFMLSRTRFAASVRTLLELHGVKPDERWGIAEVKGVLLAHRRGVDVLEMAVLNDAPLIESLESVDASESSPGVEAAQLIATFTRSARNTTGATPFSGTPFALAVVHPDPERSARPQLARIRALRIGLVGLGALVLLAAAVSARTMARARRLAELRSTFVASVSHDLRTPTQAILLMAETLEQELLPEPESAAEYHGQIRREAERLRRLVEDLLDGARIDRGGGARISRRLVETAPFFNALERTMKERAIELKAHLRIERDTMPPFLHIDSDGVHRAIWNLFTNALLHGRMGEKPAEIAVTLGHEGHLLTCTVSDSGPGVPAKYQETVFNAFERLSDRAESAGIATDTGTGLGLAIVRALARAHGGEATLDTARRDGARFVATFRTEAAETNGTGELAA